MFYAALWIQTWTFHESISRCFLRLSHDYLSRTAHRENTLTAVVGEEVLCDYELADLIPSWASMYNPGVGVTTDSEIIGRRG